jgi:hypothetical protein
MTAAQPSTEAALAVIKAHARHAREGKRAEAVAP